MKTYALAVLIATSTLFTSSLKAQCPIIVRTSFHIITDQNNPCLRSITFDFIGQSNGLSSINLTVTVSGITVINTCIDASHAKDEQKNYTSAQFTACDFATIGVSITPYTSGNCGGTPCSETLSSIGGAPLPVLFSQFSVSRNKEFVTLKWETATEINNAGFAIERNMNGSWQQTGFVISRAYNGNSTDQLQYEFSEINNNMGITQYRLKQVDLNGVVKYSDTRVIRGTEQDAKTSVFPNPSVNGSVSLVFADASARDILITDMAGRTINQWNGFNSNSLQVKGLSTGMFSIRILHRATGAQSIEKIIVAAR